jgi:hypothetical protein
VINDYCRECIFSSDQPPRISSSAVFDFDFGFGFGFGLDLDLDLDLEHPPSFPPAATHPEFAPLVTPGQPLVLSFTTLEEYKTNPVGAPSYLGIRFHEDLAAARGLVLMEGAAEDLGCVEWGALCRCVFFFFLSHLIPRTFISSIKPGVAADPDFFCRVFYSN